MRSSLLLAFAAVLALSLGGCFEDPDVAVTGDPDALVGDGGGDIDDPCNGENGCPCTLDEQCKSEYCAMPDDPTATTGVCDDPCGGSCPAGQTCKSVGRGGKKKFVCMDDIVDPGCTPSDEVCDGADNDCDGVTDESTCDDDNACTVDDCDPTRATDLADGCTHTAIGLSCDDGNPCTEGDACNGGACAGTAKSCDDGNPCTTDSCDSEGICQHAALGAEGGDKVACDDGSPCSTDDHCLAGACVGTALDC
ncbi:MAG: hypothetical protein H6747_12715, partial [Deltaproteobacteria bacterium]|nr:hypothetical protein [Deltaproteobacteria bacterium]